MFGNCKTIAGDYTVGMTINLDSCFGNAGGRLFAQLK
jgi:hypothetical protein